MKAVNYASIVFFVLLLFCLLLIERAKADFTLQAASPKPIKVMIIDTGADFNHPLLKGKKVSCAGTNSCTDTNGHGTAVTSLVLNGELTTKGKAGTPVCKSVEVKVCNYFPSSNAEHYYACLALAVAEAPMVVNFSSVSAKPDFKEYDYLRRLQELGTFVVAAAGNEGDNILESPNYPTMYTRLDGLGGAWKTLNSLANIITVGAVTHSGQRYILSNYIDGMRTALGVDVRTAGLKNTTTLITGTSASTALYTNKLLRTACGTLQ